MLTHTPIKLRSLFGREGRERCFALVVIKALPKSHGDLRSFTRRQLEKSV